MNQSRVCITKKLREAQKCVQKTNLLVYEKKRGEDFEHMQSNKFVSHVRCVPGKKIRICTGAELKKTCPPKPCACPCPKPPLGILSWIGSLIKLGFKVLIAGGIVYWTIEKGIWGTPDSTEELYTQYCQAYAPRFCPESMEHKEVQKTRLCEVQESLQCQKIPAPPGTCDAVPSIERRVQTMKEKWNRFIMCTFGLLAYFPDNAIQFYHDSKGNIEKAMEKKDPCE